MTVLWPLRMYKERASDTDTHKQLPLERAWRVPRWCHKRMLIQTLQIWQVYLKGSFLAFIRDDEPICRKRTMICRGKTVIMWDDGGDN